MKTIFVTIEEFLNNGGILKNGMTIYREEKRHFNETEMTNPVTMEWLTFGELIGEDKKTGAYLLKNNSFKSFPITETMGYVKIEAKPIYK